MSIIKYFREKWLTYLFLFLSFTFACLVYKLDGNFAIEKSNANYIILGWIILFFFFLGADYLILNFRVKKLKSFSCCKASLEEMDGLTYPTDKEYGELIYNLAVEYEEYKAHIYSEKEEELDFITKWLHDIKVPIAAARLILENYVREIPGEFYQSMDKEIFSIEEAIQRVFYEMKSNRIQEDFQLVRINTKKFINQAGKSIFVVATEPFINNDGCWNVGIY